MPATIPRNKKPSKQQTTKRETSLSTESVSSINEANAIPGLMTNPEMGRLLQSSSAENNNANFQLSDLHATTSAETLSQFQTFRSIPECDV